MEVRLAEVPPMRLACMRHVGPYPEIGPVFGRLAAWAGEQGLLRPGAVTVMVTYDDPQTTPTQELRSDAGIMTPDSFDPSANPQISTCVVGNGRYAIARHKGPYAGLPGAWQEFGRWIAAQKSRSRSGPCFEVYRNDMETAAPEDLLTELYWPVE